MPQRKRNLYANSLLRAHLQPLHTARAFWNLKVKEKTSQLKSSNPSRWCSEVSPVCVDFVWKQIAFYFVLPFQLLLGIDAFCPPLCSERTKQPHNSWELPLLLKVTLLLFVPDIVKPENYFL